MNSWIPIKLKDIILYAIGGDWGEDPSYPNEELISVNVIKATDLKNWNVNFASLANHRKIEKSSFDKRKLEENDIILEISGGSPAQPVGRSVLITKNVLQSVQYPLICSNFFRLIRFSKEINAAFINYYFQFLYKNGELNKYQTNTTNLRNFQFSSFLANQTLLVPTLKEQHQIVELLDELFKKLEIARKKLGVIPRILEKYYSAVLEEAMNGNLTEEWREENNIFNQWESTYLGKVATIIMGNSPSSSNYNYNKIGYPLLNGPSEFKKRNWDIITLDDVVQYTTQPTKFCKKNDLLLCVRGSTTGRTNIAGFDACIGRGLAAIRSTYQQNFINIVIYFKQKFLLEKGGIGVTTFPSISSKDLEELEIRLPSLEEQKEIVHQIEQLFKQADVLLQNHKETINLVEKVQESILEKAFQGELTEIQEEIETVEVLLERIEVEKLAWLKAHKEQVKTSKSTKKMESTNLSILEILKGMPEKTATVEEVWAASKYYELWDKDGYELFYKELSPLIDVSVKEERQDDGAKILLSLI